MSYEETFNKLRTLLRRSTLCNNMSATVQGEIAGIGGSVSTRPTTISAHTEVETEKFNHTKKEKVIDDTTILDYPGPIYYEEDIRVRRRRPPAPRGQY